MTRRRALWLLAVLSGTLAAGAQWKKTPLQAPGQINPQLYRADANATEEINRALVTAVKQHKRVLLDFGGNWCLDCHILDNAFHQPRIAPLLNENFWWSTLTWGVMTKTWTWQRNTTLTWRKACPRWRC